MVYEYGKISEYAKSEIDKGFEKGKNLQSVSLKEDRNNESIILVCFNCKTFRTFRCSEVIKSGKKFMFASVCENCGNKIGVILE